MVFAYCASLEQKVGSNIKLRLADKDTSNFNQQETQENYPQSKVGSEVKCDMDEWLQLPEPSEIAED